MTAAHGAGGQAVLEAAGPPGGVSGPGRTSSRTRRTDAPNLLLQAAAPVDLVQLTDGARTRRGEENGRSRGEQVEWVQHGGVTMQGTRHSGHGLKAEAIEMGVSGRGTGADSGLAHSRGEQMEAWRTADEEGIGKQALLPLGVRNEVQEVSQSAGGGVVGGLDVLKNGDHHKHMVHAAHSEQQHVLVQQGRMMRPQQVHYEEEGNSSIWQLLLSWWAEEIRSVWKEQVSTESCSGNHKGKHEGQKLLASS
ncbi:hypothetical protein CLOP_g2860 [Closterium sp. NIES-67]|nr:hypothetical protein CLOP_g2860 [Closterium sp. NIES-67]